MITIVSGKNHKIILASMMIMLFFTACGKRSGPDPDSELRQGIEAVKEAVTAGEDDKSVGDSGDLREGTSANTIGTPDDFPDEYYYGSGRISEWSEDPMLKKMTKPQENQTVLHTMADSGIIRTL